MWGSELVWTLVCGRHGRKGKKGKGKERKGKEGKGWERKEKGRESKGKEGKGRERKGKGRKKEGKRKGKEGKGRERNEWEKKTLEISELGCADGCGRRGCNGVAGNGWGEEAAGMRSLAADGVGATAWLEMGGEKTAGDGVGALGKRRLMSELGCADGCGRLEMGAGDERRLRTAWVQGSGWNGEKKPLVMSELGCGRLWTGNGCCGRLRNGCREWLERVGKRRRWGWASLAARTAADGVGAREWLEMGRRSWGWASLAADGVGAREWLEMGGEKKPLVMSELGCADGCGREMGAENCADGCGRRGCQGVAGNGWGEEAAGCADGCARQMGGDNCADGCGRHGCKGVAGKGEETVQIAWGERRWEGARQHAGRRGNRANRLRRASPGGTQHAGHDKTVEIAWGELRGRERGSMLDGKEIVQIACGELRWEGARQHAGQTGNRGNSLGRASLGGSETACWTEGKPWK